MGEAAKREDQAGAKAEEIKAKIEAIPKPQMPECFPVGRWNGRFYGNEKSGFRIYVDNAERKIDKSNVAEIQKYLAEKADYQKAVAEIKGA